VKIMYNDPYLSVSHEFGGLEKPARSAEVKKGEGLKKEGGMLREEKGSI